MAYYQVVLA